jgi:hypothetical protein
LTIDKVYNIIILSIKGGDMKIYHHLFVGFTSIAILGGVADKAHAAFYPGCDCTALITCYSAACAATLGFGCIDENGKIAATALCANGGMKHCTNWQTDLNKCTPEAAKLFPPQGTAQPTS